MPLLISVALFDCCAKLRRYAFGITLLCLFVVFAVCACLNILSYSLTHRHFTVAADDVLGHMWVYIRRVLNPLAANIAVTISIDGPAAVPRSSSARSEI